MFHNLPHSPPISFKLQDEYIPQSANKNVISADDLDYFDDDELEEN